MPDFTIHNEKGASLFVLKNFYDDIVKNIKIKYWIKGLSSSKTVNVINELTGKTTKTFDLLKVSVEISAIQVLYSVKGKSKSTAIFKPDPTIHPNSYIRDLFCVISEDDAPDFYGGVFMLYDDETVTTFNEDFTKLLKSSSLLSQQFNINKSLKLKRAKPSIKKIQPIQVNTSNNIAFLDVRSFRNLSMNPRVEDLTFHWVDGVTGKEKSFLLQKGIWNYQMARIDFNKRIYVPSGWFSWKMGTAKIESTKTSDTLGIIWGESYIDSDGESGGIYIWINWINAGT